MRPGLLLTVAYASTTAVAEHASRQYRFIFTALRPFRSQPADGIQLAEVVLYGPQLAVLPIANVANPAGSQPSEGQSAGRVADGELSTKWMDAHFGSEASVESYDGDTDGVAVGDSDGVTRTRATSGASQLVLELDAPHEVTAYELFTGNDNPKRDPTSWVLYRLSESRAAWIEISRVDGANPPLQRKASYGITRVEMHAHDAVPHAPAGAATQPAPAVGALPATLPATLPVSHSPPPLPPPPFALVYKRDVMERERLAPQPSALPTAHSPHASPLLAAIGSELLPGAGRLNGGSSSAIRDPVLLVVLIACGAVLSVLIIGAVAYLRSQEEPAAYFVSNDASRRRRAERRRAGPRSLLSRARDACRGAASRGAHGAADADEWESPSPRALPLDLEFGDDSNETSSLAGRPARGRTPKGKGVRV